MIDEWLARRPAAGERLQVGAKELAKLLGHLGLWESGGAGRQEVHAGDAVVLCKEHVQSSHASAPAR